MLPLLVVLLTVGTPVAKAKKTAVSDGDQLRAASAEGKAIEVERLLAAGVSANDASDEGETPLHLSCIHGYEVVQASLLAAGAVVDARAFGAKSLRMTPLTWCAYGGYAAAVEQLLEAGADPNLVVDDEAGNLITALDIADRIGLDLGAPIAALLEAKGSKRAAALLLEWNKDVQRLEQAIGGEVLTAEAPGKLRGKEGKHAPHLTVEGLGDGGGEEEGGEAATSAAPNDVRTATVTVPHGMTEEHLITYIWAKNQHEKVIAVEKLKPGDPPRISFAVPAGTTVVTAYQHCNQHDIWASPPVFLDLTI